MKYCIPLEAGRPRRPLDVRNMDESTIPLCQKQISNTITTPLFDFQVSDMEVY